MDTIDEHPWNDVIDNLGRKSKSMTREFKLASLAVSRNAITCGLLLLGSFLCLRASSPMPSVPKLRRRWHLFAKMLYGLPELHKNHVPFIKRELRLLSLKWYCKQYYYYYYIYGNVATDLLYLSEVLRQWMYPDLVWKRSGMIRRAGNGVIMVLQHFERVLHHIILRIEPAAAVFRYGIS